MMNQTEETKLLEQIEKWNDADEFSRCIEAIEAIPEQERGYLLTVKLSRAYSNLAALGDHGEHGTDGEVDGDLIRHAIELLESVRTQGENDPYWNARMGYSCLMAYGSATTAYEYAKRWLSLPRMTRMPKSWCGTVRNIWRRKIPWNWIGKSGRRSSGGRPSPLPMMTSSAM